jgi:hypothetical protein
MSIYATTALVFSGAIGILLVAVGLVVWLA